MSNDITLLQEKIEVDLQFLLECLHEVLVELEEDDIAAIIPWRLHSKAPCAEISTARTCQLTEWLRRKSRQVLGLFT